MNVKKNPLYYANVGVFLVLSVYSLLVCLNAFDVKNINNNAGLCAVITSMVILIILYVMQTTKIDHILDSNPMVKLALEIISVIIFLTLSCVIRVYGMGTFEFNIAREGIVLAVMFLAYVMARALNQYGFPTLMVLTPWPLVLSKYELSNAVLTEILEITVALCVICVALYLIRKNKKLRIVGYVLFVVTVCGLLFYMMAQKGLHSVYVEKTTEYFKLFDKVFVFNDAFESYYYIVCIMFAIVAGFRMWVGAGSANSLAMFAVNMTFFFTITYDLGNEYIYMLYPLFAWVAAGAFGTRPSYLDEEIVLGDNLPDIAVQRKAPVDVSYKDESELDKMLEEVGKPLYGGEKHFNPAKNMDPVNTEDMPIELLMYDSVANLAEEEKKKAEAAAKAEEEAKQKLEAERKAIEEAAAAKVEAERLAEEAAQRAREEAEAARAEAERIRQEAEAAAKVEAERLAAEAAAKAKAEAEAAAAKAQAEAEKLAAERAALQAEKELLAAQKAAAAQAEIERLTAERAAEKERADRLAVEKLAAEEAVERAKTERLMAEAAAERAKAERLAAESAPVVENVEEVSPEDLFEDIEDVVVEEMSVEEAIEEPEVEEVAIEEPEVEEVAIEEPEVEEAAIEEPEVEEVAIEEPEVEEVAIEEPEVEEVAIEEPEVEEVAIEEPEVEEVAIEEPEVEEVAIEEPEVEEVAIEEPEVEEVAIEEPEVEEVAIEAPTFEMPEFEAPTFEMPVIEEVVAEQVIEEPEVEEVAVEEPEVEEVAIEEPEVEEVAIEEPVVEEPAIETPTFEMPEFEAPTFEMPVIEEVVAEPVIEEPEVEEVAIEEPEVKEVAIEEPVVEAVAEEVVFETPDTEEDIQTLGDAFDIDMPGFESSPVVFETPQPVEEIVEEPVKIVTPEEQDEEYEKFPSFDNDSYGFTTSKPMFETMASFLSGDDNSAFPKFETLDSMFTSAPEQAPVAETVAPAQVESPKSKMPSIFDILDSKNETEENNVVTPAFDINDFFNSGAEETDDSDDNSIVLEPESFEWDMNAGEGLGFGQAQSLNDLFEMDAQPSEFESGLQGDVVDEFVMETPESETVSDNLFDVAEYAEPVMETVKAVVEEPTMEMVEEIVETPVVEPVTESVEEFVTESVVEPVEEFVTESVVEPVEEFVTESVVEPVEEFVTESVVEPVTEFVQETVEKIAETPVVEEVVAEPKAEASSVEAAPVEFNPYANEADYFDWSKVDESAYADDTTTKSEEEIVVVNNANNDDDDDFAEFVWTDEMVKSLESNAPVEVEQPVVKASSSFEEEYNYDAVEESNAANDAKAEIASTVEQYVSSVMEEAAKPVETAAQTTSAADIFAEADAVIKESSEPSIPTVADQGYDMGEDTSDFVVYQSTGKIEIPEVVEEEAAPQYEVFQSSGNFTIDEVVEEVEPQYEVFQSTGNFKPEEVEVVEPTYATYGGPEEVKPEPAKPATTSNGRFDDIEFDLDLPDFEPVKKN